MLDALGQPGRVLLLGGTSEIGTEILAALGARPETEVILAGRDQQRLTAAGKALEYQVRTVAYDATALDTHEGVIGRVFDAGDVDIVISAAGILIPQETLERDPRQAGLARIAFQRFLRYQDAGGRDDDVHVASVEDPPDHAFVRVKRGRVIGHRPDLVFQGL